MNYFFRNQLVSRKVVSCVNIPTSSFRSAIVARGFEQFFDDQKNPNDVVKTGRAWTVPDLRRKVHGLRIYSFTSLYVPIFTYLLLVFQDFNDLHKLWWVLYKERNLLLTAKEKTRRVQRPVSGIEEARYQKVKRSMAAIKFVLGERKKIQEIIKKESENS
jgi:hypothetical protein